MFKLVSGIISTQITFNYNVLTRPDPIEPFMLTRPDPIEPFIEGDESFVLFGWMGGVPGA